MSWKQVAQYSFADALLFEYKSLSKLDDVHEIIDWKQIETTFSHLYSSKRDCARKQYSSFLRKRLCKKPNVRHS